MTTRYIVLWRRKNLVDIKCTDKFAKKYKKSPVEVEERAFAMLLKAHKKDPMLPLTPEPVPKRHCAYQPFMEAKETPSETPAFRLLLPKSAPFSIGNLHVKMFQSWEQNMGVSWDSFFLQCPHNVQRTERQWLEREEAKLDRNDSTSFHNELSWTMRAILIDWLIEVTLDAEHPRDTLYLAVCLFDNSLRQLPANTVDKKNMQAVGIVCWGLAAKFHGEEDVDMLFLSNMTAKAYNTQQLCVWETKVLAALEWELNLVTELDWLMLFAHQNRLMCMTSDEMRSVGMLLDLGMFASFMARIPIHHRVAGVCRGVIGSRASCYRYEDTALIIKWVHDLLPLLKTWKSSSGSIFHCVDYFTEKKQWDQLRSKVCEP